ncbi:G2/mitotic-specific cyclin-B3 isoform X2 [Phyllopteryx taeniolatus]|uniref:G2/mitotic-specific cyclin-B3 isoform X2 n=1 Tax=Phyllopteryx taeniolatus TaxID=161469 RepID=UPI002AD23249|nr:G2/mitotic-specific cyclin-B3 isoform X2 [Phyllopteryx taeniolatus]
MTLSASWRASAPTWSRSPPRSLWTRESQPMTSRARASAKVFTTSPGRHAGELGRRCGSSTFSAAFIVAFCEDENFVNNQRWDQVIAVQSLVFALKSTDLQLKSHVLHFEFRVISPTKGAMPFARGKRAPLPAGRNLPKEVECEKRDSQGPGVKRSTSPSHGAPEKRKAFVDISNAHKVHISFPGRKKNCGKKQGKKTSAPPEAEKSQAERQSSSSESLEANAASENHDEANGEEGAPAGVAAVCHVRSRIQKPQIPAEFDVDSEHHDDCLMCPEYAKEVFDYLKSREEKFVLRNYMARQPNINGEMRAVLVDWLVEVQENFELYHETLYLAVKLTDHYLARNAIQRDTLQLVGATAMLLASKFECASVGMETLTLARYFCELSLMDAELALERGSLLAAACLLLALRTKHLPGWSPILQFHSGYGISEVAPVVRKLYGVVAQPPDDKLKAVRSKYSHEVFFQVASLPLVDFDVLEKTLSP